MTPSDVHQIYLVPGFFGFVDLGQVVYFSHVREALVAAARRMGIGILVHVVSTEATASIRRRAALLVEQIAATAGERGPISVIGHSTGGLDARLALTPGAVLPTQVSIEPFAARVKAVVTVSCPHHGTPLASFFVTLYGKKLLWLLSLTMAYALRFGRLPTSALLRLVALFVRLDDHLGWRGSLADQAFEQLLGEFSPERRQAVRDFLRQVVEDQTLMEQLTPGGIDLFNASAIDRPGVRYGSVVSCAEQPGLESTLRVGLDPYAQATHGLFAGLHRLARRATPSQLPKLDQETAAALAAPLGRPLSPRDNDGVVPALSQVWGELIGAVRADHLDVIGHFGQPGDETPTRHYDWFASGSAFERPAFDHLWGRVARFVATA